MTYKTVIQREITTDGFQLGMKLDVAVGRELTETEQKLFYWVQDEIEKICIGESLRLNPEMTRRKKEEKAKLLACFGDVLVFSRPIMNGYCSLVCCSQRLWYEVTTTKGVIVVGWRKRVINID